MICVNSVNVNPKNITVGREQWYYGLQAQVLPEVAECKSVMWYSDDPGIAAVSKLTGYVYGVRVGTTRIYAEAIDGSGCKDYATVIVNVPVTDICLSKSHILLDKGNSAIIKASVYPMDATDSSISWSSDKSSVVSVNNNGTICALKTGTAKITAHATDGSNVESYCYVTVTENVLVKNICVCPEMIKMKKNQSGSISATVIPENATNKEIKWFSSNDEIVTINPTSGAITALNHGTAVITAVALDGSGVASTSIVNVEFDMYQKYQEKNRCYINGANIGTVKGIVVHSTGANNKTLKRYVDGVKYDDDEENSVDISNIIGINNNGNHWNKDSVSKMVHGFIGLDKNGEVAIVNTLPYNVACWGVGNGSNGSYNYSPNGHIQFEICEDELTNEDYYLKAVWGAAIQYCAYLCKRFNLSADKVVDHKEAHDAGYGSSHVDIHHWLSRYGNTMDEFRLAVQKQIDLNIE